MKKDLIQKADDLLKTFLEKEYACVPKNFSIVNQSIIPLAYTEYGPDEHEDGVRAVDVKLFVKENTVVYTVNDLIVRKEIYKDLKSLIDNFLQYLDFDTLVSFEPTIISC